MDSSYYTMDAREEEFHPFTGLPFFLSFKGYVTKSCFEAVAARFSG